MDDVQSIFLFVFLWSLAASAMSLSLDRLKINPDRALHRRMYAVLGGQLMSPSTYTSEQSPLYPVFAHTWVGLCSVTKCDFYLPGHLVMSAALLPASLITGLLQFLALGGLLTIVLAVATYDLVALFLFCGFNVCTCERYRDPKHVLSSYKFDWFSRRGDVELTNSFI